MTLKTLTIYSSHVTELLFWDEIQAWQKLPIATSFSLKRFGLVLGDNKDEICLNVILCLAKFFTHKNRIQKCPPSYIFFFKNEFDLYKKVLKSYTISQRPKIVHSYEWYTQIFIKLNIYSTLFLYYYFIYFSSLLISLCPYVFVSDLWSLLFCK